ncbi:MAG: UDP-N-acetylmuramoyl-L-alanine--D-glutamate ligase [Actinomycetota bacterium]|nr:UDP-N-acetylmuramoyl-L-alanine--D-glutamate ligase [Actinomycetota bacterium]
MGKPRPPIPPGPYLVVGLARSGIACALALRARGETVIGCDAGSGEDPALAAAAGRLSRAGVEVMLNATDDAVALRTGARAVVKSPGVPPGARPIAGARARGLPVLGEVELGWRLLPNEFVAVTGTNGKTTTAEWVGHIHREAALPVTVAGNVGTALTSLAGELPAESTVVCEVSSFQLEDTLEFSPEAAVLTNISPDHFDRHGTYEAYVAAKLRAFVNQGNHDLAVIPGDLEVPDVGGCARRVLFGSGAGADLSARAGYIWWLQDPLVALEELALPGEHNVQNAMAAAAACLARAVDVDAVRTGLRTFPGVPHRLEPVATRDGVRWINDSKATNVASTLVALRAFSSPVHLIAGGRGKQQDFSALAPLVRERCVAVYLIGEAAGELAATLAGAGVPVTLAGELENAVSAARMTARDGEVVLFSPACASFDQYLDFEARGEHFRALAEAG